MRVCRVLAGVRRDSIGLSSSPLLDFQALADDVAVVLLVQLLLFFAGRRRNRTREKRCWESGNTPCSRLINSLVNQCSRLSTMPHKNRQRRSSVSSSWSTVSSNDAVCDTHKNRKPQDGSCPHSVCDDDRQRFGFHRPRDVSSGGKGRRKRKFPLDMSPFCCYVDFHSHSNIAGLPRYFAFFVVVQFHRVDRRRATNAHFI